LSTNVNEIKNKQAQIGTELANRKKIMASRKTIVDTCKINITCLNLIPYKTSADQAVALVYYISASIKIVLNVEQTSACVVVNMPTI
jgi:hypothetical protein